MFTDQTIPPTSTSRERPTLSDNLLDAVEMALDAYGLSIIESLKAWGYGDHIAWAAANAARDGVVCIIEAEENRRAKLAARIAAGAVREGMRHG